MQDRSGDAIDEYEGISAHDLFASRAWSEGLRVAITRSQEDLSRNKFISPARASEKTTAHERKTVPAQLASPPFHATATPQPPNHPSAQLVDWRVALSLAIRRVNQRVKSDG